MVVLANDQACHRPRSLHRPGGLDIHVGTLGKQKVRVLNPLLSTSSELLILISIAIISLTAHLYVTSRVARVAVILPTFMVLSSTLNLNPVMVVFLVTVAMDYCLTLPVSSKALLMFHELEGETFDPNDLIRLSAVMLPITLLLMLLFYYGYWQWIGLAL